MSAIGRRAELTSRITAPTLAIPLAPPSMAKSQNRFLSSLSQADLGLLTPHLRTVQLSRGNLIFEQGHEIERLYFPHDGAVSFLVVMTEIGRAHV